MLQVVYDGSMAGFLTAVFEVYEQRAGDAVIVRAAYATQDFFSRRLEIDTDAVKAERVWKGLQRICSQDVLERLWYCYLSELPEAERYMLEFIRYAFAQKGNKVGEDFGHPAVLWVAQTARKVGREKHRMEAFVRFEELKDGLFYATIEPDFHVLPLISVHFERRYAEQNWLIHDLKRRVGIHYNKATELVTEVLIEWSAPKDGGEKNSILAEHEALYQALWQDYFKSTGIAARKNPELHVKHIPIRYWRYLTEKKV